MVFDPFCGCATTCVAADSLDRRWAGVDISPKAGQLVKQRIREAHGRFGDIVHLYDPPSRSDLGKLPRYNCKENKDELYGKQRGCCAGCNVHFEARNLEVDHTIAVSKGGTDHIGNLQLLCGNCNRVKGQRGMQYLQEKLRLAT